LAEGAFLAAKSVARLVLAAELTRFMARWTRLAAFRRTGVTAKQDFTTRFVALQRAILVQNLLHFFNAYKFFRVLIEIFKIEDKTNFSI